MRIRVGGFREDLLRHVKAVAPRAVWMGEDLVVPGAAANRPAALEALRAAGAEIKAIVTEEGRLDALYRDLVDAEGGGR
jgi:hypothetical protein